MARPGKAVYVTGDLMLLNRNTDDENAKKVNVLDLKGSINFKNCVVHCKTPRREHRQNIL